MASWPWNLPWPFESGHCTKVCIQIVETILNSIQWWMRMSGIIEVHLVGRLEFQTELDSGWLLKLQFCLECMELSLLMLRF